MCRWSDSPKPQRLSTDPAFEANPSWSPDNLRIAYLREDPPRKVAERLADVGTRRIPLQAERPSRVPRDQLVSGRSLYNRDTSTSKQRNLSDTGSEWRAACDPPTDGSGNGRNCILLTGWPF